MALKIISSWAFNGRRFVEYMCEDIGDGIPLHEHTFNHTTKCTKGKIECFTADGRKTVRDADDLDPERRTPVIYKAGLRHGIKALTRGAIFINDMPVGGEDEHEGAL